MRWTRVERRAAVFIALALVLGDALARPALPGMAFAAQAAGSAQAQFELDADEPFRLEARCPQRFMLIHWRTGREQNVDVFRVHRRAADSSDGGEWVNSIPLVAQGDNSSYTIVDASAQPGQDSLYTLYGFVAADGYEEPVYLLSEAQAVSLGDAGQATCVFLPTVKSDQ